MIRNIIKRIILLKRKSDRFPLTIIPRHLYIFPNKFGLFFILVLFIMLAGSVNYHNNSGYMMTFLLGGMYLLSFHMTQRNLKGLRITNIEMKPVFEGGEITLVISIVNPGTDRINLGFEIPGFCKEEGKNIEKGFSVIKISKTAVKRGVSRVKEIVIYSEYPLGLTLTWTYLIPDDLEAIVYPKPLMTSEVPYSILESGFDGDSGGGSKSGADDFSELKDYVPGDPVQRIAWKSLSKGHGLLTKYFNGSQAPVSYIINWDLLSPDSVERKLAKLAYLVTESDLRKKKYGIAVPGKTIAPSYGEKHLNDCLRLLAEY